MNRILYQLGIILVLLALVGCVTVPRNISSDIALQRQLEREQVASVQRQWAFTGRIAVSRGNDGGQAKIQWKQSEQGLSFDLDAPLGAGRWQLVQNGEQFRLSGFSGGVREGTDPQVLLREATGFDIPFDALPFWVRGLRKNETAAIRFDEFGNPNLIEENGWRIQYDAWDKQQQPLRITATQSDLRLRLVIDQWGAQ